MDSATQYLKAREAAAILGLSEKTIYRLAADPRVPVLRIGGSVRFPRTRFLAWLAQREQGRGRPRAAARRADRGGRPETATETEAGA